MTGAVDAAVDAAFEDPNTSDAATYTPAAGDPVSCRVIWKRPDAVFSPFAGAGVAVPARIADVRVSEVTTAAGGDSLTVGGATYPVESATQPDPRRLKWRLHLGDPVA